MNRTDVRQHSVCQCWNEHPRQCLLLLWIHWRSWQIKMKEMMGPKDKSRRYLKNVVGHQIYIFYICVMCDNNNTEKAYRKNLEKYGKIYFSENLRKSWVTPRIWHVSQEFEGSVKNLIRHVARGGNKMECPLRQVQTKFFCPHIIVVWLRFKQYLRCSEENVEEVCGWGHEVYGYQGVCSAGSLCLEKCN